MAKVGQYVKESLVKELSEQLTARPNFLVASLTRLNAADTDSLRKKLFNSHARLVMIKRKLGQRAVAQFKLADLSKVFEGSIGVIVAESDVLSVAKEVVAFAKGREERIVVRGGLVDGLVLDKKAVEHLASLPSKPQLLAEVLGTIEAPLADVIFTIERLIGDLAWVAEQASAKTPATEPGTPPAAGSAKEVSQAEGPRPTEPGAAPLGAAGEGSPEAGGRGTPPQATGTTETSAPEGQQPNTQEGTTA